MLNMQNIGKYDKMFTLEDIEKLRNEYKSGFSIREICTKYGIKSKWWFCRQISDISRDLSTSCKLAHKKYPDSFKQTEKTREKIRSARLRFMKEHPEETAWRKRNKPSYPESCFIKYLKSRGYDKKYEIEREKSFFPYFVDFAFNELKLAIEIDGSQHITDEKRIESDTKKDKLLNDLGWKVIHYTEQVVKKDWDLIDQTLDLNHMEKLNFSSNYGIYKYKSNGYQKVKRDENGKSEKEVKRAFEQRKCIWPTKEELSDLISKKTYVEISKLYNVCDHTIVKWCKYYGIYVRKRKRS